ncbi:MAG: hypothetical protein ACKO14_03915 [Armatimonadota bacterium]
MNPWRSILPTVLLIGVPAVSNAQRSVLDLTADRTIARADGRSNVVLSARVFVGGQPAADGTIVRFASSGGRFDQDEITTRGGIARVSLIAPNTVGQVRVTASVVGGSNTVPASVTVDFVDEATFKLQVSSTWLTVRSDSELVYAVNAGSSGRRLLGGYSDNALVMATNGAITVRGTALQVDVVSGNVVAIGSVRVSTGSADTSAKRVSWNPTRRFLLAELESGTIVTLDPLSLLAKPVSQSVGADAFTLVDQSTADVSVISSEVSLELGGDFNLLFKHARLLVDGQTLAVLPLHRMTVYQRTLFRDQLLGFASTGLTVDVPYTYQASRSGTGVVHLRRGAQFGSSAVARRAGWGVDIEQQYRSRLGNGTFQVLNVQDGRRGSRLQHSSRFGTRADASVFVDVPNGKDIYGSLQAGYQLPFARLGMFQTASRFVGSSNVQIDQGFTDYRQQLSIESNPIQVGLAGWRATLSAVNTTQRTVASSMTTRSMADSYGTRLLRAPQKIAPNWLYSQVLSLNYVEVVGLTGGGLATQSSSTFRTSLTPSSNFQWTYDYLQQPQLVTLTSVSTPKHRLSFSYDWTTPSGGTVFVNSTQGLDVNQSSTSASVSMPLRKDWELRVNRIDSQLGLTKFRDTEFGIVKLVDGRAIGAYYSTTAKQLQVDFTGGVRF